MPGHHLQSNETISRHLMCDPAGDGNASAGDVHELRLQSRTLRPGQATSDIGQAWQETEEVQRDNQAVRGKGTVKMNWSQTNAADIQQSAIWTGQMGRVADIDHCHATPPFMGAN
jgi:hypothetical protein